MGGKQNSAIVTLSRVLEDAARIEGTPAEDMLVHLLELRSRTEDPTPLPPAYFIRVGNNLEYIADTQGNFSQVGGSGGGGTTDRELRVRFAQQGGIGGWSSTYEADDSILSADDATQLRQHLADSDFFNLPDQVANGNHIADGFTYVLWISHGRRNRELTTYDGTGPHGSPKLEKLIDWLKQRAPQPGAMGQSKA